MHDRIVRLDRVLNFRDFGGYDTVTGARLARGRLWRSAHFANASDDDVERLGDLGVSFIVDLRRPDERQLEPNRWPGAGVHTHTSDGGAGQGLPPHLMALLRDDLTAESCAAYMRETYRGFPFDPRLVTLYRAWFADLATRDGAAVIHCAAGKDRTGLGCALTLIALGVPEDAVYADYEFTNQAVDIPARLPRIQANMEKRLGRPVRPEALEPMLGVDVDYLREAFRAIDAKYGGVPAYLESELGVGARERASLLSRFAA